MQIHVDDFTCFQQLILIRIPSRLRQGQKREHVIAIVEQAMRGEVQHFVLRRLSFCHSFARLRTDEHPTLTSPIESRKGLDLLFSLRQRTESFKVRSSK